MKRFTDIDADYHPRLVCLESQDLGYARLRDIRERRITVALSLLLAALLVILWRVAQ